MWKEARVDLGKNGSPINHNELALLQYKKKKGQHYTNVFSKIGKTFVDGYSIKCSKIHD